MEQQFSFFRLWLNSKKILLVIQIKVKYDRYLTKCGFDERLIINNFFQFCSVATLITISQEDFIIFGYKIRRIIKKFSNPISIW
jgi:hypothetical protein